MGQKVHPIGIRLGVVKSITQTGMLTLNNTQNTSSTIFKFVSICAKS